MKRSYHTIDWQGKVGERRLAEFLVRHGQLQPMVELIEQSWMAIDELIDVLGRACIEPGFRGREAHPYSPIRSLVRLRDRRTGRGRVRCKRERHRRPARSGG